MKAPSDNLAELDLGSTRWTCLYSGCSTGNLVTGTAPSPRFGLGFASANGLLFVFGGTTVNGTTNELFELNLATKRWTNLTSIVSGAIPSARSNHTFDSVSGRLYAHGGDMGAQGSSRELFEYDPVSRRWTNLTSVMGGAAPVARFGHSFTSANGKLFLHGGWTGTGECGLSPLFR